MDYNYIITGLGNPGEKYERTRHNVGFLAVDFWAEVEKVDFKVKNQTAFSEVTLNKKKILILKPLGFMNKSGEIIKNFLKLKNINLDFFRKNPKNLIIIHDDSDQIEGDLKIVKNGGTAGHKGIENIYSHLGKNDYLRIKIGIRPKGNQMKSETFVLKNLNKNNLVLEKMAELPEIIESLIINGLEKTQSKFN
jgi:PTH1 family peptidyl-tRNA hydrolase